MIVVRARDLADAHQQGMTLLLEQGRRAPSRDGDVLTMPEPVTTVYEDPTRRVLFSARRDANPFFHLFESMWMLAGMRDGRWLDRYVRNFSARYAETDGQIHGAYGQRWREHFQMNTSIISPEPDMGPLDQLDQAVRLLREQPNSRQVVIAMWDPTIDLGVSARDRPCNTHVYLRIRGYQDVHEETRGPHVVRVLGAPDQQRLDMTVLCRSNDAVMGAYGANAVHMSVLQEYLATRIGVPVGRYWQVSNDFHCYERDIGRYGGIRWGSSEDDWRPYDDGVLAPSPLFSSGGLSTLDREIEAFMDHPDSEGETSNPRLFEQLLTPMHQAHTLWKNKMHQSALRRLQDVAHDDWRTAAEQWIRRRVK